jgi:hypothetical protein
MQGKMLNRLRLSGSVNMEVFISSKSLNHAMCLIHDFLTVCTGSRPTGRQAYTNKQENLSGP